MGSVGALCRYMRLPFQPDWDLASCPSAASTKNGMRSGRSDQVSAPKLFKWRRLADLGRLDPVRYRTFEWPRSATQMRHRAASGRLCACEPLEAVIAPQQR